MADTTGPKLSMKLLIDEKARRVVFAEAGKDVVDFLFSLLAIPIGAAVELIGKDAMVGSAGDLYASVDKLDSAYLQPGAAKDAVLRPDVPYSPAATSFNSLLRLPPAPPPATSCKTTFFVCESITCHYVTEVSGKKCPSCGGEMAVAMKYVGCSGDSGDLQVQNAGSTAGGGGEGLVQDAVTYTVTDNLTVTPMSAISVALLNADVVSDLGALQEKTVQIGDKEQLGILRASLHSKTVLTDVYLAKKPRWPE